MKNILLFTVATSIIMFGAPQAVVAQSESASNVLEEIVVTATRRDESMQDVPISLTALSADDITGTGAVDLKDMAALVPNFVFGEPLNGVTTDIVVRGIYTQVNPAQIGFEQNVNVYMDGVYMGKQFSANPDMGAIERVEVLRGPQGTLFGKNAMSGAINIISKKPSNELEGSISVDLGSRDLAHFKGRVNIPIIEDRLALQISAGDRVQDGFVTNTTRPNDDPGSVDRTSGRVQLRYTGDRTTVDLSRDFSRVATEDYFQEWIVRGPETNVGFTENKGKFTLITNEPLTSLVELSGTALAVEHVFDNDYTLTAIGSWREDEGFFETDIDNGPVRRVAFATWMFPDQDTYEIRITSPADGAFDFVAGVYYIDQYTVGTDHAQFFVLPPQFRGDFTQGRDIETKGASVFFHGNYRFSDALTLFGGVRYMSETKKSFTHPLTCPSNPLTCVALRLPRHTENVKAPVDLDTDEPTGSIGLRYNVNDNVMVYGSVARGLKSTAFNNARDPVAEFAAGLLVADPSFVTSYELGFKASLWDRRAELNFAVFDMDYTDLQVRISCAACNPGGLPVQRFSNAAKAFSRGFEVEFHALLTDTLRLTAGLGNVKAEYESFPGAVNTSTAQVFDAAGKSLAYAPDVSANVALNHEMAMGDGVLTSRLDVQHISDRYARGTVANNPEHLIPSQTMVNARVTYRPQSGNWGVAAWVKNVADDDTLVFAAFGTGGLGGRGPRGQFQQPRTAGVTLDLQF